MKNLCKEIFRKRLIIEAKYNIFMNERIIENYIIDLSKNIWMTIILWPIVKDLAWEINSIHKWFEWITIWAESWISVYTWNKFNFMTLDIYSCKDFDENKVLNLTKKYFNIFEIEYKMI